MLTIDDNKIRDVMQGVIDGYLIPRFVQLGMNATGKWIHSLQADAVNGVGYIKGMHYTQQLVNGRAPGKRPPIAPLQEWVSYKLGLYGNEGRSVAFAIATKIEREGTDYYPEGTDLLEVLNSKEVQQYIYNEIGSYFKGQLVTEIKRMAWQTLT